MRLLSPNLARLIPGDSTPMAVAGAHFLLLWRARFLWWFQTPRKRSQPMTLQMVVRSTKYHSRTGPAGKVGSIHRVWRKTSVSLTLPVGLHLPSWFAPRADCWYVVLTPQGSLALHHARRWSLLFPSRILHSLPVRSNSFRSKRESNMHFCWTMLEMFGRLARVLHLNL